MSRMRLSTSKMHQWYVGPIFWTAVMLHNISVFSMDVGSPAYVTTPVAEADSTEANSVCTGLFTVGTAAKVISFPKTTEGKPLSCRWVLKSSHYNHKVALSNVGMEFSIGSGSYFQLQARDGKEPDSPILINLEYENETFLNLGWNFVAPIVSSGEYLVLEYTNHGNNPFLIDFLYYTCGGVVNARTYVSSPIFSADYPVPNVVECQWYFIKPADALYGSVKLLNVNVTEASVLQISTNSSMKVLEYVDKNQTRKSNKTAHNHPDSNANSRVEKIIEWANRTNNTSSDHTKPIKKPTQNITVQSICGSSISDVVFDGEVAILRYHIIEPRLDVGFNALYFPVKVPKRRKPVKVAWYVNYSGITIYTPIGVLIGSIIIFVQSRKRGPSKTSFEALTRSFNSEPRLAGFQFSFRSERNLRFGSIRSVPENLSKSLTNLRTFLVASDSGSRDKKRVKFPQSSETLKTPRQHAAPTKNVEARYRPHDEKVTIVISHVEDDKNNNDSSLKIQQPRKLSRSAENVAQVSGGENITTSDIRRTKSATFYLLDETYVTDLVT